MRPGKRGTGRSDSGKKKGLLPTSTSVSGQEPLIELNLEVSSSGTKLDPLRPSRRPARTFFGACSQSSTSCDFGQNQCQEMFFAFSKDLGRQGFVRRGGGSDVAPASMPVSTSTTTGVSPRSMSPPRTDSRHDSARAGCVKNRPNPRTMKRQPSFA